MARVPSPVPGCDVRSLPISPKEAYVLSRVDALTNETDLAIATGLEPPEVAAVLDRLRELGAISFQKSDSPPDTSPRSEVHAARNPLDTSRADAATARIPVISKPASNRERPSDNVELEPDKRRKIVELYEALSQKNHYDLLGISGDAGKKEVKHAYYALVPEFHPDKYFRKELGEFKQKIEAIFARLTLAHDVLTSAERRVEYDAYLEQTRKNRAMSAVLEQTSAEIASAMTAVELAAIEPTAPPPSSRPSAHGSPQPDPRPFTRAGSQPDSRPSPRSPSQPDAPPPRPSQPDAPPPRPSQPDTRRSRSPSQPDFAPSDRLPPSSAPRVWQPDSRTPESERLRREAFARKLLGANRSGRASSTEEAGLAAQARRIDPKQAAEALRARFLASRAASVRKQLERYLQMGHEALEQKEYARAANAYRVAASLAPDDAEIEKKAAEAQKLAAVVLADGYFKQGEYEASQGRWEEAALSYGKACAGRPEDPVVHDRAALAVVKGSGNTRLAVDLARHAVSLSPSAPQYRVTLARAYLAAGLGVSAEGQMQRAIELAPNDAKIRALVAEVRRGARGGQKVG